MQGSGDLCALDSGRPVQQPPVKAATENRRGARHRPLAVIEPGQPGAHGIGEPWRDSAQVPGSQQILHQQGQAFGIPHDRRDRVLKRQPGLAGPGARASHVTCLIRGEAPDRANPRAPRFEQRRDILSALAGPDRAEQQRRHLTGMVDQIPGHREGRVVGPMQILQDHDYPVAAGIPCGPPQHLEHGFGRDHDRLGRRRPAGFPPVRHQRSQHRHVRSQPGIRGRGTVPSQLQKHLGDGTQRTADPLGQSPAMDSPDVRLGRGIAQVLGEPGLPDSRLAHDDQRSAAGVTTQPTHRVGHQRYRSLTADKNRTAHPLILPRTRFRGTRLS